MKDLIDRLTRETGVTEAQARGGAAALFKAAQQRMDPKDFEQHLGGLPGVRDLMKSAPQPSGASGLLGGLASMIGGADSDMAQATRVLTAFGSLGMGKNDIWKFVPVISDYLETHGGADMVKELRAALRL